MSIVKHLIADEFGSHIGKYSERLKVTQNKETLAQAALLHLESVLVSSRGVSISADALEACCAHGIPVFFVDSRGEAYASLYSAGLIGTTLTRRAQLLAYSDWHGVAATHAIVAGKIENQAATLKYMAKNRKETHPEIYKELHLCADEVRDTLADLDRLQKAEQIEAVRQQIMSIEAVAGKRYWAAVRIVIPEEYGWQKREQRGATDPINSLLNYGYGILYGQVERALILAGLDPYAGFLHADRPGKPSLVLDVIEEFRQVVVDRLVFGLANRHYMVQQEEDGKLSKETRRDYAEKVLERLEAQIPYEGKRQALRHVIQCQARHLAVFLRGEREVYEPLLVRW